MESTLTAHLDWVGVSWWSGLSLIPAPVQVRGESEGVLFIFVGTEGGISALLGWLQSPTGGMVRGSLFGIGPAVTCQAYKGGNQIMKAMPPV